MNCPVCGRKGRYQPYYGWCKGCGLICDWWGKPKSGYSRSINGYGWLRHLSKKQKPAAIEELSRLFRHSEWSQWTFLLCCPLLREDMLKQEAKFLIFADWCADNGFPLQEAAVRKLLEVK